MTEERFWYDFEDCTGTKIVDFKEYKEYPLKTIGDFKKIEKLLNEQHETIQQLKAEIKQLNHDLDLYEENNTNEVLNKLRIELTSRMNDCIEEFKE